VGWERDRGRRKGRGLARESLIHHDHHQYLAYS
jgi:hypothetical protein